MFTLYDWAYGIAQLAAGFLAVISMFIAMSLLSHTRRKELRAWKFLLPALFFFALVEVFGGLASFGVINLPFLTHVTTGVLLALLITALVVQLQVNRGWLK